ncbi:PREDICTED: D site-binding protein-like [Priapulus caudatus]|uniref:D site-binding protein-like n=1 Tax=Priapulus caudatus TaxID=37621 RepID=A0ABM1F118_PRICU|nr:PREDICTED: D site-binding protein-like [Priapulus caudatus]
MARIKTERDDTPPPPPTAAPPDGDHNGVSDDDDGPLDFSTTGRHGAGGGGGGGARNGSSDQRRDADSVSSAGSRDSRDSFDAPPPAPPADAPNGLHLAAFSSAMYGQQGAHEAAAAYAAMGIVDPRKQLKPTRPFKAYPRDPLSLPLGYYGIPFSVPIPGMEGIMPGMSGGALAGNELYGHYIKRLQQAQETLLKGQMAPAVASSTRTPLPAPPPPTRSHAAAPAARNDDDETMHSEESADDAAADRLSGGSGCSTGSHDRGGDGTGGGGGGGSRKRARSLPDDSKDEAYWERRRKNNEAAKRSRDARRAKEDEIAIRAAFLEQENLKLRVEVASLKNETAKLRCMLYNS